MLLVRIICENSYSGGPQPQGHAHYRAMAYSGIRLQSSCGSMRSGLPLVLVELHMGAGPLLTQPVSSLSPTAEPLKVGDHCPIA